MDKCEAQSALLRVIGLVVVLVVGSIVLSIGGCAAPARVDDAVFDGEPDLSKVPIWSWHREMVEAAAERDSDE